MINLSDYSCDKCAREFSRHCKHCYHTADKAPTRFKKKKKTGSQVPPQYDSPPMPPVKPPNTGSSVQSPKQPCPYELPCGWCAKWDKKCEM